MKDTIPANGPAEWLGHRFQTMLRAEESGGAMSIIETVSRPGSGPPRHIHHDADEVFVCLTGDLEFELEGERFIAGPGRCVFVPRGEEHAFRVVSDVPSRHLVIFTPGGFETFFEEMGAGGFRIPEDMAQVEQSAARHHLTFTGPPLADLETGT